MRRVASLFLALTLLFSVFSGFTQPLFIRASESDEYETSWLGYDLTKYLFYNGSNGQYFPVSGGNYTLQALQGMHLGIRLYYPSFPYWQTYVDVGAEYSAVNGIPYDNASFIRNTPILVGVREKGGFRTCDQYVASFLHPFFPAWIGIANLTNSGDSDVNTNRWMIYAGVGNQCSVNWNSTWQMFIFKNETVGASAPFFALGILNKPSDVIFLHNMTTNEQLGGSPWTKYYYGDETWFTNDTALAVTAPVNGTAYGVFQFWKSNLPAGNSFNMSFALVFGDSEDEVINRWIALKDKGFNSLLQETIMYYTDLLNRITLVSSADYPWLSEWYNQTVLGYLGTVYKHQYNGTYYYYDYDSRMYPTCTDSGYHKRFLAENFPNIDYELIYRYLRQRIDENYPYICGVNDNYWNDIWFCADAGMLFAITNNMSIANNLMPLVETVLNHYFNETNHFNQTMHLIRGYGGLDHEFRYYNKWAGDSGYYLMFNFMLQYALYYASLMADAQGDVSAAERYSNLSMQVKDAINNYFWNGTMYQTGINPSTYVLNGSAIHENLVAYWFDGEITSRQFLSFKKYIEMWNCTFPPQYDTWTATNSRLRGWVPGLSFNMLCKTADFKKARLIMQSYFNLGGRPLPCAGETFNPLSPSTLATGTPFTWSYAMPLDVPQSVAFRLQNQIRIYPCFNFTVRWSDGTKIVVTKHGNDSLPLTEYAVNGSRVQVTGWDRQINFTISSGKTYLIDVYFGSRPALTNLVEQLEFFNRTEVWNAAEKELNITFTSGLPSSNRVIMIYCDTAPSSVEGGVLINCSNSLAAISLLQSSIMIKFAPAQPPSFYVWGVAAAAGGGFAYWLYRMKRKKTS